MISVNLTTILFKIKHIDIIDCFFHNALNTETSASTPRGYSQKVGSAYQRMKGDIPESEYLPFDLLLLEPAAF